MWAGIHIISKCYLRRLLSTALGIHKVNYPREIPTATRCGGKLGVESYKVDDVPTAIGQTSDRAGGARRAAAPPAPAPGDTRRKK